MKIVYYRYLAMLIFVSLAIPAAFEKYFIMAIIFIIGVVVAQGYSCPYCGKAFDIRSGKRRLQHCPNCGKRLHL